MNRRELNCNGEIFLSSNVALKLFLVIAAADREIPKLNFSFDFLHSFQWNFFFMRAKSATKEIFPLSKNDQTFDVKVAGKYKFLVTGK